MAKAKDESQDHGSNDQSHGKATAKTSRLSKPKPLTKALRLNKTTQNNLDLLHR